MFSQNFDAKKSKKNEAKKAMILVYSQMLVDPKMLVSDTKSCLRYILTVFDKFNYLKTCFHQFSG